MTRDLVNAIDELTRLEGPGKAWRRAMDFMTAYLSEFKSPLPDVAERGLKAAKEFQRNLVDARELERARVECWRYLKERSASTDITTSRYCGVRAVICVLSDKPPQGADIADLLDFFIEVADRFENHSDLAEPLLDRFFFHKPLN